MTRTQAAREKPCVDQASLTCISIVNCISQHYLRTTSQIRRFIPQCAVAGGYTLLAWKDIGTFATEGPLRGAHSGAASGLALSQPQRVNMLISVMALIVPLFISRDQRMQMLPARS